MSTKMNQKEGLTDQESAYVHELMAEDKFNMREAAKKAGYKNPGQASYALMQRPHIQKALRAAQRRREKRCDLKAEDVWSYLGDALYLNPLKYFMPDEDGNWTIESLTEIPDEVGRLIDGHEIKFKTDLKTGKQVIASIKVTFVSKSKCLDIAMRHCSPVQDELKVTHTFDFDKLFESQKNLDYIDPVQQVIIDAELKPHPNEGNGNDNGHKGNGHKNREQT